MNNKDRFKAGIIQFNVRPGKTDENLSAVVEQIHFLGSQNIEIAVLPEMWSCGFDNKHLKIHAKQTPEIIDKMCELSLKYKMIIAGSMPETSEDEIFNTLYVTDKDGSLSGSYRKIHLFSLTEEEKYFHAGNSCVVCNTSVCRLGLMICYDLRFPELCRYLTLKGAQIVIVPAQWPLARIKRWDILTQARALENQIFLIGVNRCGKDWIEYGGHSQIVSPLGNILTMAQNKACTTYAEIDLKEIDTVRKELPCLDERASFLSVFAHNASILELNALLEKLNALRASGKKIVFTNGCFDILHIGHIRYLTAAKEKGDVLIVGLNSDASVRAIKGKQRPIISQDQRAEALAALRCIDYVTIFDEPDPFELIRSIKPDVLVKGADWAEAAIIGADVVKAYGGKVERIPLVKDISTSIVIQKMMKKNDE